MLVIRWSALTGMALASMLPTFDTAFQVLQYGPVTDTVEATEIDSKITPFTRLSLRESKATVNTLCL